MIVSQNFALSGCLRSDPAAGGKGSMRSILA
jgi:hypothetical protein